MPSTDGKAVLFVALVDLLQRWNQRKHWEMCFKGLAFSSTSSVPPAAYRERFMALMDQSFC